METPAPSHRKSSVNRFVQEGENTMAIAQTVTNHLLAAARAQKTAEEYYSLERRARNEGALPSPPA